MDAIPSKSVVLQGGGQVAMGSPADCSCFSRNQLNVFCLDMRPCASNLHVIFQHVMTALHCPGTVHQHRKQEQHNVPAHLSCIEDRWSAQRQDLMEPSAPPVRRYCPPKQQRQMPLPECPCRAPNSAPVDTFHSLYQGAISHQCQPRCPCTERVQG